MNKATAEPITSLKARIKKLSKKKLLRKIYFKLHTLQRANNAAHDLHARNILVLIAKLNELHAVLKPTTNTGEEEKNFYELGYKDPVGATPNIEPHPGDLSDPGCV